MSDVTVEARHLRQATNRREKVSEDKSKTETQSRTDSLQQKESSLREEAKSLLRKKRKAIREGHATGGYCETGALLDVEKDLYKLLSRDMEEAKAKYGYSPDPKFKPKEVRDIELELHGLAYKPALVVKE